MALTTGEIKLHLQRLIDKYPSGDLQIASHYYTTAVNGKNIDPELIEEKWTEYLQQCKFEGRESRFMKSIDKFLKDEMWTQNFNVQLTEGQGGFMNKLQQLLKDVNMS